MSIPNIPLTEAQQVAFYGQTIKEMRSQIFLTDLNDPVQTIAHAIGRLESLKEMAALCVAMSDPTSIVQSLNRALYFLDLANNQLQEREK